MFPFFKYILLLLIQLFHTRKYGHPVQPQSFPPSRPKRRLHPRRRRARHLHRNGKQTRQSLGKHRPSQTPAPQQPQPQPDRSRGRILPAMQLRARHARRCRAKSRRGDGKTAGAAARNDAAVVCRQPDMQLAGGIPRTLSRSGVGTDFGQPPRRFDCRRRGFGVARFPKRARWRKSNLPCLPRPTS